jgi:hypothetical protein
MQDCGPVVVIFHAYDLVEIEVAHESVDPWHEDFKVVFPIIDRPRGACGYGL